MPSKLRKAIGAVKDQTSISLAKVSSNNATNLEVVILKSTTHEELPIDVRYVNEILQLVSSDKAHAAACAQALGKRLSKTRNWIVALKSLMLVLRIFQDGDPYFPREVLHAMKRGAKILNLSNFRDDSNSSPWDYTAFVRTFALYLDERLDCFLTGKLQRRITHQEQESGSRRSVREPIREMKPAMLLDRISYWQKLLDRAIATRPTGSAKSNNLVQIAIHAVVKESFELYRDISDCLALLLDSFFHLQYQSCVLAFQACVKATKQFEELASFYELCKSIGVGRVSEYPTVQHLSDEVIETLREFLKDQSSFSSQSCRSSSSLSFLQTAVPKDLGSSSGNVEAYDQSEPFERLSDRGSSHYTSRCTSLEDLMSVTDPGASPARSIKQEQCSDLSEKQTQVDDFVSAYESESFHSLPMNPGENNDSEFAFFDDWSNQENENEKKDDFGEGEFDSTGLADNESDAWELVLAETTTRGITYPSNDLETTIVDSFFNESSISQQQYNPFLQDPAEISPVTFPNEFTDSEPPKPFFPHIESLAGPTFQAPIAPETVPPTFRAENCNASTVSPGDGAKALKEMTMVAPTFRAETTAAVAPEVDPFADTGFASENDPFAPCNSEYPGALRSRGLVNEENILQEQKLWMEFQDKIIARHSTT